MRAAATFLAEHTDVLPEGAAPTTAQLVVLAIQNTTSSWAATGKPALSTVADPDPEILRMEVIRRTGGEHRPGTRLGGD